MNKLKKLSFSIKIPRIAIKLWLILAIAFVLRVLLSLATFHPDIRAFNLGGQLVSQGHIFSFYDYLSQCAQDNNLVKTFGSDLFIYPPLIYLYHGIFNFIFTNLFGDKIMNGYMIESLKSFYDVSFNFHLLLLKFPYLIFDFLMAFVIYKLFDEQKQKNLALILWLFNPVNLYASYMMGQFDLIPVFFTVLTLYFVKKQKFPLGAVSLGLGAAFKVYPLLLLIPLMMLETKWVKRIKLGVIGVLPYLISILPYLPSPGFRSSALLAGLTQKTLFATIPVSGGESLMLFPLAIFLIYILFLYARNMPSMLWEKFFVLLSVFFVFTHFHPQWLVWLTPFLIIDLVTKKFKHVIPAILILGCFILSLFFFDKSLTVGIFAPLLPPLYEIGDLWKILHLNLDFNYMRSIIQTIFASSATFYIIYYFPKISRERE